MTEANELQMSTNIQSGAWKKSKKGQDKPKPSPRYCMFKQEFLIEVISLTRIRTQAEGQAEYASK